MDQESAVRLRRDRQLTGLKAHHGAERAACGASRQRGSAGDEARVQSRPWREGAACHIDSGDDRLRQEANDEAQEAREASSPAAGQSISLAQAAAPAATTPIGRSFGAVPIRTVQRARKPAPLARIDESGREPIVVVMGNPRVGRPAGRSLDYRNQSSTRPHSGHRPPVPRLCLASQSGSAVLPGLSACMAEASAIWGVGRGRGGEGRGEEGGGGREGGGRREGRREGDGQLLQSLRPMAASRSSNRSGSTSSQRPPRHSRLERHSPLRRAEELR